MSSTSLDSACKDRVAPSQSGQFLFKYNTIFLIIIIFIIIISFMQSIYTYIPETNYVPSEYSVAALLLLLFMVHISLAPVLNLRVLHFYTSTFRSMCAVAPRLLGFPVRCSGILWMIVKWFQLPL